MKCDTCLTPHTSACAHTQEHTPKCTGVCALGVSVLGGLWHMLETRAS